MSTTCAMVALANTCATACATTLPSARALVYTAAKPRGPVLENTLDKAVATPTDKRGLVMPKFWGLVRPHRSPLVLGGMADAVTPGAWLYPCFQHPAHLLRLKTQMVALESHKGAKTMTHVTQGRTAPVLATSATHPNQLFADAVNAASMANWYTRRGNIAAAARKARQHLAALNQLAKLEGGAA